MQRLKNKILILQNHCKNADWKSFFKVQLLITYFSLHFIKE